MRILSGIAKGRQLHVPKKGVRPTTGILKKALFEVIKEYIHDAKILDLFSGSGALGFEALSRGAREVLFVEKNREAIITIKKNFEKFGDFSVRIRKMDVFQAISLLDKEEKKFDVVFADPPYVVSKNKQKNKEVCLVDKLVTSETFQKILGNFAIIALERRFKKNNLLYPPIFKEIFAKSYGDSELVILKKSTI